MREKFEADEFEKYMANLQLAPMRAETQQRLALEEARLQAVLISNPPSLEVIQAATIRTKEDGRQSP